MNATENNLLNLTTLSYMRIIMGTGFAVIFLLGTIGNILVIYVLGKRKKKVIIFSLAIICQYVFFVVLNVNSDIERKKVSFSCRNKYFP